MNKEYIKEFGIGIFAIAGFTRVLRKLQLNHAVKSYERFKYVFLFRQIIWNVLFRISIISMWI